MYVSEEFYFLSYRFPILIQFNVIFFQFFSHFVFVFQFILEIYFLSVSRFFSLYSVLIQSDVAHMLGFCFMENTLFSDRLDFFSRFNPYIGLN